MKEQTAILFNMENHNTKIELFMEKFQGDLAADIKKENIKAEILGLEDIDEAAQRIRMNKLVAFPTETVYGLGANATDEKALLSIYSTKRRPLTDPIIVHVLDQQQALSLAETTEDERQLFTTLTNKFWPGPLTVILKANLIKLPLVVTAGSGYVGLRSPKQPTARKLIQLSGLPIGAPSANLFGHVSPTEPVHVFNDFYDQDVTIIDGQRCEYGLESTVVKLFSDKLQILRQGSLTVEKLRLGLKGSSLQNIVIEVMQLVKKDKQIQQSPGQLFRHYAPHIPCYYLQKSQRISIGSDHFPLKDSVVISFSQTYDHFKPLVGQYLRVGQQLSDSSQESLEAQDFFCSQQEKKRMKQIYYLLRKAQNSGHKLIVIAWQGDKAGAIWDKVSRSTEAKEIYLSADVSNFICH